MMGEPNICTKIVDVDNGVIFRVMAYRELSNEEALSVIMGFVQNMPLRKRPKRGRTLTILTVIGILPGL